MSKRTVSKGLLLSIVLLTIVAFVGCEMAGYDITEINSLESRKPSVKQVETTPPTIFEGTQGAVVPVDEIFQYETRWGSDDPRYRELADLNEDGIVDSWEVVAEDATHALVGERFIGYYSRSFGLWAGQDNYAGEVTISNGTDGVTISVDTTTAADVAEYHIYAYTSAEALPDKRPAPGLAPYVLENVDADSFQVFLSFEELGGTVDTTYYFIIHAALVANGEGGSGTSLAGETAYAAGGDTPDFTGKGAWFYVVGYTAVPYFEPIIEPLGTSDDDGDDDVAGWAKQTAYAGNSEGSGSSWWFYIDATGAYNESTVHAIYAGQKLVPGALVTYAKEDGILSIEFGDSMQLQEVTEPIKIQGYSELPNKRPSSGGFDYKFDGDDDAGSLYIGTWDYVVVHFDALVNI